MTALFRSLSGRWLLLGAKTQRTTVAPEAWYVAPAKATFFAFSFSKSESFVVLVLGGNAQS